MYPSNMDWHGYKGGEPVEEPPKVGSVATAWQWRERGINPPNQPPNKTVLENIAEDILVQKPLQITSCDLPGYPRSTFLMVFSPDGTKLASTHGNHNIYVSELASGKHVRILRGHPRTPWCIAFHPSHPQLIGSGCLGGQVRVWDISSGGSEVWNVYNETVIASIAFHPREQLLVIATYNELYFWDWSQPAPFTKVSTKNINEKVRYVAFDSLGFKLITGISLWACSSNSNNRPLVTASGPPGSGNNSNSGDNGGPGNNGGPGTSNNPGGDGPPRSDDGSPARPPETPGAAQDMIVNSYQTLVQRYDSLVRNYQRLFMVRHRLINTPPLANTIDRGTDPMETYPPESGRHRRRSARRSPRSTSSSTAQTDTDSAMPLPATLREQETAARNAAAAAQLSTELLQLGGFSTDPVTVRSADSSVSGLQGVPMFRSVASAFQPLGDERTTRLLPNPFSSTNTTPRQPNSSRTSGIFRGPESALSALRQFSIRRRNIDAAENAAREHTLRFQENAAREHLCFRESAAREHTLRLQENAARNAAFALAASRNAGNTPMSSVSSSPASNPFQSVPAYSPPPYIPPPLPTEPPPSRPPPPPEPTPGPSGTSSSQPSSNNSSNHMNSDPADPHGEAHTINESLDLIRDILRDSGTRLLNLITNMSMNILSNSERDESARVPVHVFTGNLRRDFMASSSDSESEHPEVNITRTPNTTFREAGASTSNVQSTANRPQNSSTVPQISNRMTFELDTPNEVSPAPSREGGINISDRMTFELQETSNEGPSREGGINVSMSNDRFRVRTQGNWSAMSGDPGLVTSTSPDTTPSASTSATTGASTSATPGSSTSANPGASTYTDANEPQPGPSTAPDSTFDPNVPSTSRDNFWSRGPELPAAEAIRRVQLGVSALQKHTLQLANMWLRGDRTTMRDLRTMWDDLRRRIMALHREAGGRADTPSFYTRSLLERCMILTELTEMTDLSSRQFGRIIRRTRSMEANQASRNAEGISSTSNNPSTSSNTTAEPSTSAGSTSDSRNSRAARAHRIQRNKRLVRLQQAYRWRAEDEMRRRERNSPVLRLSRTRHRSNLMRTVEQNATRHVIRTRAMKVLSVMFNMMMMCLEERGLSQLIINMLKTLKKALALTCFMMMSNRNMARGGGAATPAAQSVASADVVRIQNAEHSGPVNVEDGYDPHSLRVVRYDAERDTLQINASKQSDTKQQNAATSSTQTTPVDERPSQLPNSTSQSWSHRLAVQIAAANRNNSSTAKTRRDMYIETRRQKALHRTNPTAHPFIRRRFPPVMSHRIPTMRNLPPGRFQHRVTPRSRPSEPEAGPSSAPDQPTDPARQPHEDRDNFIRLARFRRLQTIRLYTPSSVREMFALQEYQQENRNEPNGSDVVVEDEDIPFAASLPVFRNRAQFHALLVSNGVLPVMHVNDLPPDAAEAPLPPPLPLVPGSQPRGLPRIHEYLQPIILAQNAMVVEDADGGGGGGLGPGLAAGAHGNRRLGGMAGLLDAGIISEALPAPSHRVQAWDFTTGAAPDIADNTKNVVVQRCRIHNDASIDISKDGRLLVALLPVPRLRNTNNWLGVYSLEWPRLGQCLHTAVLEQSAVSVALSPTARYLAVGLGSRRFTSSHSRTNIIALLYKLDPLEISSRTGLSPMKELEQYWEHGFTSLNCLRWAPQPGQGLVYANNTGQLIIMS